MKSNVCLFTVAALAAACGDDPEATRAHAITVYGEDFVEDHIPADETDGWRIDFDELLVVVSDVRAGGESAGGPRVFDLARPSGGVGHPLATLPGGPHATLDYRIAPASAATGANATAAQVAAMTDNGWSIYVRGTATREGAARTFTWGFTTDTTYRRCQTEPTTVDGDTVRSSLTFHADHLFYDDLVDDEPNVAFQLIADADTDGDGDVTEAELRAVDITGLDRYQVGNRDDVTDLWAFIEAQSRTVGHIDGEGHCDGG